MSKLLRTCVCLLPVVIGVLGAFLLFTPTKLPAQAGPTAVVFPSTKATDTGPYLISSSGAGQIAPNGKMDFVCAAYVVDSQTGDIYFIVKDEEPRLIGSVAKKK